MVVTLALVTGATSGIGLELCRLLASKKISLIITGRDQDKLGGLVEELSRQVLVTALAADLATETGRKKIVLSIRNNAPDLVINNAGFGQYGEVLEQDFDPQLRMVDVNAKAVLELTLEAAQALRQKNRQGVILNVSSVASFMPFPLLATYAATKAFVTSLSISLDFEFAPHGIRVLASCPGVVETNFRERAGGIPSTFEMSMSVAFAAQEIWRQIEKKQRVRTFDWKMRVAVFLVKHFVPTSWVARLLHRSIEHRLQK